MFFDICGECFVGVHSLENTRSHYYLSPIKLQMLDGTTLLMSWFLVRVQIGSENQVL